MRLAVKAVLDKMRKKKDRKLKRLSILAKISKRVTSNYVGKRDCNRTVMLHFYAKRQTRICTTRPRFPFTCHLLFIISAHKFVILHNFFFAGRCNPTRRRTAQVSRGGGGDKVVIDCIASFLNNMGISQTFKIQKWFFFKESTLFYSFLECQCHYFTKMVERGLQNLYYSLGLHRIIIICNSIVFQAQELPWVLLRNRWTTSFRFMYVR